MQGMDGETIAKAYQIDLMHARAPLPPDELMGVDRLDPMARSLGLAVWDESRVLRALTAHPCSGVSHVFGKEWQMWKQKLRREKLRIGGTRPP
jgi:hypothetical protein